MINLCTACCFPIQKRDAIPAIYPQVFTCCTSVLFSHRGVWFPLPQRSFSHTERLILRSSNCQRCSRSGSAFRLSSQAGPSVVMKPLIQWQGLAATSSASISFLNVAPVSARTHYKALEDFSIVMPSRTEAWNEIQHRMKPLLHRVAAPSPKRGTSPQKDGVGFLTRRQADDRHFCTQAPLGS